MHYLVAVVNVKGAMEEWRRPSSHSAQARSFWCQIFSKFLLLHPAINTPTLSCKDFCTYLNSDHWLIQVALD